MADDRSASHSFSLRQLFPWLDILRATNLAFNPGKILLGAFGAFMLAAGWWLIGIPFATARENATDADHANVYVVEETRKFPWEPSALSPPSNYQSVVQGGN